MNSRAALSNNFLAGIGWGDADRCFLAGDASDRSYDRVSRGSETAVLMDAPPGKGDDPADFLMIAEHLIRLNLSAPRCFAKDLSNGFLLLEDLGDSVFARLISEDPSLECPLYAAATEVLSHIQSHLAPNGLGNLSAADWAEAACLALTWYRSGVTDESIDPKPLRHALMEAIATYADGPRVMILRDYHAENLIWLPKRRGMAKVGLLDFQLAQMGQPGYDLVSLLQDARRDVSPEIGAQMLRYFVELTGANEAEFRRAYAILGVQRALRILGIFARLCMNGGKAGYLHLMPRVWAHLQKNLSTPEFAPLAKICNGLLPEPTSSALARIGSKCGRYR